MDSVPQKNKQKTFFCRNFGVTLSILQYFTEYSATRLLLQLSKSTREFHNKHQAHVERLCLPRFPDCGYLKLNKESGKVDCQVFKKGLRKEQHIVKVLWVKEQLFVVAYKDFTFDLFDITELEKHQIEDKDDAGADKKEEESKTSETATKSPQELDPLTVILKGLPIVAPAQAEMIQQALLAITKKRCDVPMYPEHLQIQFEGDGEDKKTTGTAFMTIDTVDKARRVAIFFDEYALDKKHKIDTSASCCLQADQVAKEEHKEFPPLLRVQLNNEQANYHDMMDCQLHYDEAKGSFKIIAIGFDSNWFIFDMNEGQAASKGPGDCVVVDVVAEKTGGQKVNHVQDKSMNIFQFKIIHNLNYGNNEWPNSFVISILTLELKDYNQVDDSNQWLKKNVQQLNAQQVQSGSVIAQFSKNLVLELENDDKNTLGFDLEAQKPGQRGFTKLAVTYQNGTKCNFYLYNYYGDFTDPRNNLQEFKQKDKTAVPFCVKQVQTRYIALSKISVIELFDLVTMESIRMIDDLGLNLSSIFNVYHPSFNVNTYYHQLQKQPDLIFEGCVGYQMKNIFAFGIKTQADIKLTEEQEKELAKEGFIGRLPPKRDAIFKTGEVKNIMQVWNIDDEKGKCTNHLYYCLNEDEQTFYRVQVIIS